MIATLRETVMLPSGAVYRKGQRFIVRREFMAKGEDGLVKCLSLGNETGDYLIPNIDSEDVDIEQ